MKRKFPIPWRGERLDSLQVLSLDYSEAVLQIAVHTEGTDTVPQSIPTLCVTLVFVNAAAKLQRNLNHSFLIPINGGRMTACMEYGLPISQKNHQHLQHLRRALQLLRKNQLFLKNEKNVSSSCKR